MAAVAMPVWLASVVRRDVSMVDSLWSLFFMLGVVAYIASAPAIGPRTLIVLTLVSVWAIRLSAYISWRNHGRGEDRRYQAIRARNQPHFWIKSLYLVFLLQAALAWIVSLPLLGAVTGQTMLGWLDLAGIALCLTGIAFETVSDAQLALFKRDPDNSGQVMDRGLWRYTRHPNYFGDFCVWWGFFLLAAGAGAWWSVPGPLLMSFFLLKVSGVALLEQDIGTRRPGYADYVRRTNAFFPGLPKADRFSSEAIQ
jgi:steroid 5-alpha reductase family enzyme